jgi:hypothetical protein
MHGAFSKERRDVEDLGVDGLYLYGSYKNIMGGGDAD